MLDQKRESNHSNLEKQREKLKRMLQTRFRYYCTARNLSRDEHHRLADLLAQDLTTNEWETLKAHLEYDKAQAFYGSKEMWDMIQRAKHRIDTVAYSVMDIYPIPDAIVHALLDTGE